MYSTHPFHCWRLSVLDWSEYIKNDRSRSDTRMSNSAIWRMLCRSTSGGPSVAGNDCPLAFLSGTSKRSSWGWSMHRARKSRYLSSSASYVPYSRSWVTQDELDLP